MKEKKKKRTYGGKCHSALMFLYEGADRHLGSGHRCGKVYEFWPL